MRRDGLDIRPSTEIHWESPLHKVISCTSQEQSGSQSAACLVGRVCLIYVQPNAPTGSLNPGWDAIFMLDEIMSEILLSDLLSWESHDQRWCKRWKRISPNCVQNGAPQAHAPTSISHNSGRQLWRKAHKRLGSSLAQVIRASLIARGCSKSRPF